MKLNPFAWVGRMFGAEPNPNGGPTDDFWYAPVGEKSLTGLRVTPENAMLVSTVFACVKVISETLATLPLIVYERVSEHEKMRAYGVPEYKLLHSTPNGWQTPYDLKENLTAWAALHGRGIAQKIIGPTGAVEELDPIHPSLVRVEKLNTRRLRYWVRQADGTEKPFVQGEIFHLRGFSLDGIDGVNLSRQAREAIALAQAMEAFAARYFANDATVGLVLEHPGKLGDEAHKHLASSFAGWGGVMNAFRAKILEEGMKLNRVSVNAKDSQLTEARLHQVVEICRYYRMPPHKVQHLMEATFSNIEHQAIEFSTDTIKPWAVRWEEAVTRDIIVDDEKYFAEFNLKALMRGDNAAQSTYYRERFNIGTLSRNDIRALENENPIEGGDTYYIQGAMVPIGDDGKPEYPDKAPGAGTDPRNTEPPDAKAPTPALVADPSRSARTAFRVLVTDAAERIANAEAREIEKRIGKAATDPTRFAAWAEEYYSGAHLGYIGRTLAPLAEAWNAIGGAVDAAVCAEALTLAGGQYIAHAWRKDAPDKVVANRRASIGQIILSYFPEDSRNAA